MAVPVKQLKAFRGLQKGKKGGTFVVTEGGKKRYTKKAVGGGEAAAAAPKKSSPVARMVKAKLGGARKTTVPFEAVPTKPLPKVKTADGKLRPGGGAGAQLPPKMVERLKALGVSKLPASHIAEVHVSPHLGDDVKAHTGALIKWKDDKGRQQSAYSSKFDEQQAVKKWERITKNRPKVEAALTDMKKQAQKSPAHAAALLMQHTSLRPGSEYSVKHEGHYGATTLEGRHIKFKGDKAHIEFIGKQGKVNKAVVSDPDIVSALKAHAAGKGPKERVFVTTPAEVRAAAPKGVKLKDFRTIGATKHAEAELAAVGAPKLTGDTKKDARAVAGVLKAVSESVSNRLNNTPAMARRSYIAPQVVADWAKKHAIPKEIIKWP